MVVDTLFTGIGRERGFIRGREKVRYLILFFKNSESVARVCVCIQLYNGTDISIKPMRCGSLRGMR